MNKAKIVKVIGPFTEYYAPTYREPYEDNAEYRKFYDKKILPKQPVIGPELGEKGCNLCGDLHFLCERMTIDTVEDNRWDEATHELKWAIEKALSKPIDPRESFAFTYAVGEHEYKSIKVIPLAEVPPIVEESLKVYGPYADLVRARVAAI